MRLILRIIGLVVVLVVLAAGVLWYLNDKGYIDPDSGLSKWITNIQNHLTGISDDTQEFLQDEGYISTPSPEETVAPSPAS
ncbi:MAG: hypothetical protein Q4C04_00770 [Clostridia bacterium]|nr:hypothetical protein [Clostridia bacterium]